MSITCEREFIEKAAERSRLYEAILRDESADSVQRCGYVEHDMFEYDARVNGDREGAWMMICGAHRFWPHDPRPGDFDINDIALSLSRICRFNGHVRVGHYSVAQHSVLVSRLLPPRLKLFGLMHDASEGYLGDIVSPLKRLFKEFYEPLEDGAMSAIAEQYGFIGEFESGKVVVKRADTIMLATEARDVSALGFVSQRLTELPLSEPIGPCWGPSQAQDYFLQEFKRLTNGKGTERALSL